MKGALEMGPGAGRQGMEMPASWNHKLLSGFVTSDQSYWTETR